METNTASPYFPYFVQAAKELGNYFYDFSYLRQAMEDRGLNAADYLSVEENHIYSAQDLIFTDAQKEAFPYDDTMNKNLKNWVATTNSKVIMVYGSSDPWYAVRIPDTENPAVKRFVSERKSHRTMTMDHSEKYSDYSFETDEQELIIQTIEDML